MLTLDATKAKLLDIVVLSQKNRQPDQPPIAQPQWMALLVRDVAAEFGVQPLHVCNVLREEGQGDFSVNTAITPDQYAVVCERLKSYASPVARPQAADPAQQLPHAYLLEKLRRVMPMLQEARDALTAITEAQRKLHGISASLADRMDAAGTYSLDDWQREQPLPEPPKEGA